MRPCHLFSSTVVLMLLTGVLCVLQAEAAEQKPNILLVVADDMGWTDLGSFGSEIETPNLDGLAQEGVKFSSFYASLSCSPTRSMLLSGNDNHIAGIGNMAELLTEKQKGKPGYEGYLNDRVVSLAEVLKENGYHTYMAGKWHLGHKPDRIPHARGFERSLSMMFGGASHWSDKFGPLPAQPFAEYFLDDKQLETLPGDFYSSQGYADFLMEAIRENRGDGKPFLAYLAFTSPHDPLHVPEPWLSKYRGRYDEGYEVLKAKRAAQAKRLGLVPDQAASPESFHQLKAWDALSEKERALSARGMEIYAGMVDNMDYHFGRVLQFLKDIGEYDNTIVIFMSDNGSNPWAAEDYPGTRGSEWFAQFDNSIDNLGNPMSHYAYGLGWGSASSGPLDRFKLTFAEGGIRVPMIIKGRDVEGGRKVDAFVYVWDLMPTILDYADITHPDTYQGRKIEPMRGRSLKSLLNGSAETIYGEDEAVAGELGNGKWVRRGNYKALSIAKPYGDGQWRLYDIVNDPGETHDLADEQAEKLKELRTAWDNYAEQVGIILME